MQRLQRWLLEGDGHGSGPAVAWLFQKLLALTQAIAFASLAVQVAPLLGSRGILPWAPFATLLHDQHVSQLNAPSVLRFATSDGALVGLAWMGVALALLAMFGVLPRLMLGLGGLLYLSFITAGRDFFTFQWDAMLLECTLLALFLPTDRPARWIHVLFRVLLFKLYFESGIAKWSSQLGDWKSGSAMTLYYETAPIPTWLAYVMHHLPAAWHHLESWATLVLELGVPLLIFGPRWPKRIALAAFSFFQLADLLTANYGFFCYLSLALGVFLLDDRDLPFSRPRNPPKRWEHPALLVGIMSIYLFLSAIAVWPMLAPKAMPEWARAVRRAEAPFWAVNVFHLFGSITTMRIEPRIQTLENGTWVTHPLRYEPGPPDRAPPFVAPHQPRLDFQLWFYGLRPRGQPPEYVDGLLEQLCRDPAAIQKLFPDPLAEKPDAVRINFARYTFATSEEHAQTGAYWHVQELGVGPQLHCAELR